MIWQAKNGFGFRLAGGYIAFAPPRSYRTPGIRHVTTSDSPSEMTAASVRTLVQAKSVDAIVVADPAYDGVAHAGGVPVYRVRPGSCRQA